MSELRTFIHSPSGTTIGVTLTSYRDPEASWFQWVDGVPDSLKKPGERFYSAKGDMLWITIGTGTKTGEIVTNDKGHVLAQITGFVSQKIVEDMSKKFDDMDKVVQEAEVAQQPVYGESMLLTLKHQRDADFRQQLDETGKTKSPEVQEVIKQYTLGTVTVDETFNVLLELAGAYTLAELRETAFNEQLQDFVRVLGRVLSVPEDQVSVLKENADLGFPVHDQEATDKFNAKRPEWRKLLVEAEAHES